MIDDIINTAASGELRPQTLSGDSAPCTPAGCTAPRLPLRPPPTRTSGFATGLTMLREAEDDADNWRNAVATTALAKYGNIAESVVAVPFRR